MYVLLTVDLNHTTDAKRTKFNQALEKHNWTKFRATTTTWYASFKAGVTADSAIQTTKNRVAEAAAAADIASWNAVCHAGESRPTVF